MNEEIPKPRVYVAGPIAGSGDKVTNLRNAIKAAEMVREAGAIPFVPHLFLQWEMISPQHYEYWMEMDFTWIRQCHALVRIDGESPGADREVALCKELCIPVYANEGVTGAARGDIFTGIRHFCSDLKSGKFDRHRLTYEIEQMNERKSEEEARMLGEDELYVGIHRLQELIGAWIDRQPFRDQAAHQPLLGIAEEVGELCHAHLKHEQGIRGMNNEDLANTKKLDALGDIFVYMAGYARANNLSLAEAIRLAWTTVRARDWNEEKTGLTGVDVVRVLDQPSPYSSMGGPIYHKPKPATGPDGGYHTEEHGD